MIQIKLTSLLFGILLLGCNQAEKKITLPIDQSSTNLSDDKEKLQQLVRRLYEWHETESSNNDFEPIADEQDSIYIGLDLEIHDQRQLELKQTDLFEDQFIANYNKIALTIDKGLKSKNLEWLVGDLPPFGNGSNPWCNCQDNPDSYWEIITISNLAIENTNATFTWTWGDKFEYVGNAIKENDNWKISFLQGFNFNEFTLE